MKALKSLKLAHKLPLFVVGFGMLVTAILVTISTVSFQRSAELNAQDQLSSMVADRKLSVQTLLDGIHADVQTLASVPSTATAIEWLTMTWNDLEGNPGQVLRQAYIDANPHPAGERHLLARAEGDSPYHMHHESFHPAYKMLIDSKGYYDAFLINLAGDIVYSVFKENDFGTNMMSGPFKDSGLGKVYREALEGSRSEVFFADMEPYAPSAGAAAAFAAAPVVNDANLTVGVLAVQIPVDMLGAIINNEQGMGDTTQVYLVGSDMQARTKSRFEGGFDVLSPLPPTKQVVEAFDGKSHVQSGVPGLNGHSVLAYSEPLPLAFADWAIIAEQDWAELMAPAVKKRNMLLMASLICAGGMSLFGWLFARTITKPIDRICADMEAVSSGDLDTEVAAAGRSDEIGKIGKTLVSMQDDLKLARAAEEERAEMQRQQQEVVESLSTGLMQLADGDFSREIKGPFPEEYEQLRKNFNSTVTNLSGTVQQVIDASGSIRNGAAEISQASDDLSHRTESQAATLEETAAALDELTASVKSAAEGARSVEATMAEARTEAENNREVVQSAVSAMTEIEQSSNHISQIISVIDDIAFQTNLLALNAGVEAARAGEAGKGFAVVASEVRALAQRSSDAAMEIKTLIGDSSKQVERGVDLVGKAGEALQSIVERVTHISQLVSGIAEGAAEQSTGLNEINTGVTQLDQVTQQNAAMVEEATAAGHMLNTDATKLAELVAHFRVAGVSPAARPAPAAAPAAPARAAAQPAPSAHGSDDWEIEASAAPAAVPAAASGNAARDLWQDF
ncbi:methyl-accepting chemotaxis protein (plasmid) [Leisingera aquaemixtae]|uniref:methyl-accepting chemotaxis protein n=1 Tax=Leisingera aquaemixtae TaxID=1396826 RepID=UPI0021A474BB|nr:methyl-accepting chemotaxis protein [Leisingera aquaemixtae]UWQ39484.1 methyl-accepting chemotaxis protein [Leisingera aquaemixtae]